MRWAAAVLCVLLIGSACAGSDGSEQIASTQADSSIASASTDSTQSTSTTQWKPAVKTAPWDGSWVGGNKPEPAYLSAPGDCVEVFMFEESDEPFDQESVFEYSVTSVKDGMTVRPKILDCDQLPYLDTKNEGPSLMFEIRRPLTTYSDQFNLFFILDPGDERFYGAFPEGRAKPQQTFINHIWVVRLKPRTQSVSTTNVVGGDNVDSAVTGGAGDCIEAFMFEESDGPSDTNSILEYTFSPTNPDTNVRLRILSCDALRYLGSVRNGAPLEFTVRLNVDDYVELDLMWLDSAGIESVVGPEVVNFPSGTLQPVQTYAGHVFVVRYARPQPTIVEVERCDLTENRQPFKFRKDIIQGWEVHFECVIEYTPTLMESVTAALEDDLKHINSLLPEQILSHLKTATPFFVVASDDAKVTKKMKAGEGHGFYIRRDQPPEAARMTRAPNEYAGSIVVSATGLRIIRDQQPAGLTLHELAHAWHCLNWDPCMDGADEIMAAYNSAMEANLYDSVERNDGEIEDAYATENDREYFAELTEAWFWENDYYPYNREQLLTHDPVGAAAVEAAWTVNG